MKNIFQISIMAISLLACQSQKQFEFPAAMLPHVKAENQQRCEKGFRLYNLNCASCHNLQKGKKTIIPDFTEDQVLGYTIRVSNAQHEKSMPDTIVTEEELVLISNFLNYKTKSGIPAIGTKSH